MKEKIYRLFEPLFERTMQQSWDGIAYRVEKNIIRSMFVCMGIQKIREICDRAEEKGEVYLSFADIFSIYSRDNLERENAQRLHAYYELLPKLDEYRKAFKNGFPEISEYHTEYISGAGMQVKKKLI